jgi:hypothetical protein
MILVYQKCTTDNGTGSADTPEDSSSSKAMKEPVLAIIEAITRFRRDLEVTVPGERSGAATYKPLLHNVPIDGAIPLHDLGDRAVLKDQFNRGR